MADPALEAPLPEAVGLPVPVPSAALLEPDDAALDGDKAELDGDKAELDGDKAELGVAGPRVVVPVAVGPVVVVPVASRVVAAA